MELDSNRSVKLLEQLLVGLEAMRPKMIVVAGRYFSDVVNETAPYDKFKDYFEAVGNIVRDENLLCLRDHTQWVFIPSIADPGQMKLFPMSPIAEHLISGFKGATVGRIKKVTLANNPARISFRGKEMVICRYNYLKKIK